MPSTTPSPKPALLPPLAGNAPKRQTAGLRPHRAALHLGIERKRLRRVGWQLLVGGVVAHGVSRVREALVHALPEQAPILLRLLIHQLRGLEEKGGRAAVSAACGDGGEGGPRCSCARRQACMHRRIHQRASVRWNGEACAGTCSSLGTPEGCSYCPNPLLPSTRELPRGHIPAGRAACLPAWARASWWRASRARAGGLGSRS